MRLFFVRVFLENLKVGVRRLQLLAQHTDEPDAEKPFQRIDPDRKPAVVVRFDVEVVPRFLDVEQLPDHVFPITAFAFGDVDAVDAVERNVVVCFSTVDGHFVFSEEDVGIVGECFHGFILGGKVGPFFGLVL